jgi:ribosome-binding factor A
MSAADSRIRKIEAQLQRVIAALIVREVRDPRVGHVTITAVRLAADLGLARVYFVPFAAENAADEVLRGLTRAGGFLRGQVGRELGLRHAPRLEFLLDDTVERAARLSGLIDRARTEDQAKDQANDPAKH